MIGQWNITSKNTRELIETLIKLNLRNKGKIVHLDHLFNRKLDHFQIGLQIILGPPQMREAQVTILKMFRTSYRNHRFQIGIKRKPCLESSKIIFHLIYQVSQNLMVDTNFHLLQRPLKIIWNLSSKMKSKHHNIKIKCKLRNLRILHLHKTAEDQWIHTYQL